jgi:hypothetical protein
LVQARPANRISNHGFGVHFAPALVGSVYPSPGVHQLEFATIAFVIACYFLPGIVAAYRNHHSAAAIMWLNLFLGWTLLGWVGALVWAFAAVNKPSEAPSKHVSTASHSPADELTKFSDLLDKGHITTEQFNEQKKRILGS